MPWVRSSFSASYTLENGTKDPHTDDSVSHVPWKTLVQWEGGGGRQGAVSRSSMRTACCAPSCILCCCCCCCTMNWKYDERAMLAVLSVAVFTASAHSIQYTVLVHISTTAGIRKLLCATARRDEVTLVWLKRLVARRRLSRRSAVSSLLKAVRYVSFCRPQKQAISAIS